MRSFAVCLVAILAGCGPLAPPPKGRITIDSRPRGAMVRVNGEVCPSSPCDFEMAAGDYRVIATLQNYEHADETVTVTSGQAAYKTLHLIPLVPSEEEAHRMGLRRKPAKEGGVYR